MQMFINSVKLYTAYITINKSLLIRGHKKIIAYENGLTQFSTIYGSRMVWCIVNHHRQFYMQTIHIVCLHGNKPAPIRD